jgi:hypothetical protein
VRAGKGPPGALTTAEKEELAQLRKEPSDARPRVSDEPQRTAGLRVHREREVAKKPGTTRLESTQAGPLHVAAEHERGRFVHDEHVSLADPRARRSKGGAARIFRGVKRLLLRNR